MNRGCGLRHLPLVDTGIEDHGAPLSWQVEWTEAALALDGRSVEGGAMSARCGLLDEVGDRFGLGHVDGVAAAGLGDG